MPSLRWDERQNPSWKWSWTEATVADRMGYSQADGRTGLCSSQGRHQQGKTWPKHAHDEFRSSASSPNTTYYHWSGVLLTPTLDVQLGHTQHCFSKWPHASLVRRHCWERLRWDCIMPSQLLWATHNRRTSPFCLQRFVWWSEQKLWNGGPCGLTLCRQGDLTPLTTSFQSLDIRSYPVTETLELLSGGSRRPLTSTSQRSG